jgi:hypothetical protein
MLPPLDKPFVDGSGTTCAPLFALVSEYIEVFPVCPTAQQFEITSILWHDVFADDTGDGWRYVLSSTWGSLKLVGLMRQLKEDSCTYARHT